MPQDQASAQQAPAPQDLAGRYPAQQYQTQHPPMQQYPAPPVAAIPPAAAASPAESPKPRRHTSLIIGIIAAVILLAAVVLVVVVWHPWSKQPSVRNGLTEKLTPTLVLTFNEADTTDTSDGTPPPALQPSYPVILSEDYVAVIAPGAKADHYALVRRDDGSAVTEKDAGIQLPNGAHTNKETLPKCGAGEQYAYHEGALQCMPIPEPAAMDGAQMRGDLIYDDENVRLVATPTRDTAQAVAAFSPEGAPIWSQQLTETGAVTADSHGLLVASRTDTGINLTSYSVADKPLPKEQALPAVAKDAIKDFDFGEAVWYLPQPGYWPNYKEPSETDSSGIANWREYPYQLSAGAYYLTEAEFTSGVDASGYPPSNTSDFKKYPWLEIYRDSDRPIRIEYGDADGDGYTDAVVEIRNNIGILGYNDVRNIFALWRMNPITGLPEQAQPIVFSESRCTASYDYSDFGKPNANDIKVNYLDLDPNNPCCGCERAVPKQFMLHFDPQQGVLTQR
ncbi:MAG: hypothetical protein SPJ68_02040 [Arcanobacterium sp.]|nr:hypothetical protein [Arcanobacterium sp.]